MRAGTVVSLLVLLLPPVVLLADLALTFGAGYQTSSDLWKGVAGLSALWIAGALFLVSSPARRARFARRGPRLAALTASLVVSWLVAEAVVGVVLAPRLAFHLAPPGTERVFRPRPDVIRGVAGPSRYTTNSAGIRGPEWPDRDAAWRVLCVGGSTTECLLLDDSEAWPQVAAQELRAHAPKGGKGYWFGDVGRSGYGTWHHVRLMEDKALLRQVDCVLLLCGINDLMRALQDRPLDAALGVRPLHERSNLFRIVDAMHNVRRMERRHMAETEDAAVYRTRRENRARGTPVDALPDLTEGLRQFRQNLETIAATCVAAGVEPVFATQPVLWSEAIAPEDDATLWIGVLPDGRVPPVGALARAMDEFNDELRAFCRESGHGLVDLDEVSGDPACFYDDCHFTELGARRVGAIVAEWFRRNPLE